MFLDDGVSRDSAPPKKPEEGGDPLARGKYRQARIQHAYLANDAQTREVTISRVVDAYDPARTYFFVAILHDPAEAFGPMGPKGSPLDGVQIGGGSVTLIVSGDINARRTAVISQPGSAWYFDEAARVSYIKVVDNPSTISMRLRYRIAG